MTITLGNENSGAIFSNCGKYRFALWRVIEDAPLLEKLAGDCVFIGLNPSVANEEQLDPTTRICRNYTQSWGCKRYVMLNVFSWIDSDPAAMKRAIEPIGPDTSRIIKEFCRNARTIVACWGTHATYLQREKAVLEMLRPYDLYCLKLTAGGHPHHPTRMETIASPLLWKPKSRSP